MNNDSKTDAPANAGFSFLELLLVTAVIGLISAISIPALAKARASANEASAIANLHGILKAQISYQSAGTGGCGSLADLIDKGMLPDALEDGELSGYSFSISSQGPICEIVAEPIEPGVSGSQSFRANTLRGIQHDGPS